MMKRILIPLCLALGSHAAWGQRSWQFQSGERLFREGAAMFAEENYAGCIDKLEAYKQSAATDADLIQEADYMLACAAFEQGKADAGEQLKDYLALYPDSRHADAVCFRIGSVHFDRKEYEKTIYWLGNADMDMLPADEQEAYSFRMAYALLQTGKRDRARTYFEAICRVGDAYRDAAAYYLAYIHYADGLYNKALIGFEEVSAKGAYKEQAAYYVAQIYFIQNKYKQVVQAGEKLLEDYPANPGNTEIRRIVGNSCYHLGDQKKAARYLARYAKEASQPLRGDLYLLGVCLFNQGKYSGAVQALGKTVGADEDALTQNAYLYLGQSYLKLGDKNNARMAFEAAATSTYDEQVREVALYNYALLIHETGFTGFGESVAIFEDFLNDFPDSQYSDKVNDHLVEVYLTTKNYASALASIDKIKRPSVKILEAKQSILFKLGTESFANMNLDKAIDYFSQAIRLGAYDEEARNEAYFWRGESYYRQGEYNRASGDFKTYLNNARGKQRTETYALAYYNLGYCHFKQKSYGEALSNFRRYVELAGDKRQTASCADAYNRIGDCLFNDRQFAAAEASYAKAAELLPEAGDYAAFQRGFVLGLQKDYAGKIAALKELIREYPESQYVDDALFETGRSYVLLEKNREAAETFERLIRDYPQSSLARKGGIQLGLIYYNQNKPEEAAKVYKQVIERYPGTEEARVALQDLKSVYIDLNDINAFADYVNNVPGGNIHLEVGEQDSLTYIAAEKLFMRGDNAGAKRSMEKYLEQYPKGAFSVNAQYYIGSIAFAEKDYAEAERRFDAVIASGDVKYLEESVARKAEMEYDRKDFAAALVSFRRLREVAENPDNKEAANLGIMRCALQTDNRDEALGAATELLKNQKVSPEIAAEARYVRAKAYLAAEQADKALADLKALAADTRTAHGAEAKYLLAQLYYDRNDDPAAEKVLEDFAKNGTPHQYWLARGFILWADIYIRQGDDVQARVYLNSLKNNYKGDGDDIASMIEERLSTINNSKDGSNENN